MIRSDWHTHTTASPDGTLNPETLCIEAQKQGLQSIGISDHCNYNDAKFSEVMRRSKEEYLRLRGRFSNLRFGVELSPFPKPIYDALAAGKTPERAEYGYIAPGSGVYEPALALNRAEVEELGLDYVITGVHWRCDSPIVNVRPESTEKWIAEWLRVSLWCVENLPRVAGDRLKILAHPWYSCLSAPWVQQAGETGAGFSVIPYSAHEELASALLQYGVAAECNADQVIHPSLSEQYRRQYAEFLRYLCERGIRITYGTDEHDTYTDRRAEVEQALSAVGFRDGDIL